MYLLMRRVGIAFLCLRWRDVSTGQKQLTLFRPGARCVQTQRTLCLRRCDESHVLDIAKRIDVRTRQKETFDWVSNGISHAFVFERG